MKSIKRLHLSQPEGVTDQTVVELEVGGRLGRWFHAHNWGAVTIPFPFFMLIMYWSSEDVPDGNVEPLMRVHEWTHIKQNQANRFWFVSWAKYLWYLLSGVEWKKVLTRKVGLTASFMNSYYNIPFEAEAYVVEDEAQKNGLPEWAK